MDALDSGDPKLGDEFKKAQCLMNAEVAEILEKKHDEYLKENTDHVVQISPVFEKSLAYVKRFSRYQNREAVAQVRELLKQRDLKQHEICILGNLEMLTVEEALAMVPSLKRYVRREENQDSEEVERILQDLSTLRQLE